MKLSPGLVVQVSSLCEEHKSKVDGLVARFAREHAASEVTRLQSKVSAMEVCVCVCGGEGL